MKHTCMMILIGCLLARGSVTFAQETPANPAKPGDAGAAPATQPAADARPSPLNAPGFEYPKVDSKGQATFRLNAPKAQSVVIGVGKRFALTKGTDGVWSVTTSPLPPGFHYYNVYIDGTAFKPFGDGYCHRMSIDNAGAVTAVVDDGHGVYRRMLFK